MKEINRFMNQSLVWIFAMVAVCFYFILYLDCIIIGFIFLALALIPHFVLGYEAWTIKNKKKKLPKD